MVCSISASGVRDLVKRDGILSTEKGCQILIYHACTIWKESDLPQIHFSA